MIKEQFTYTTIQANISSLRLPWNSDNETGLMIISNTCLHRVERISKNSANFVIKKIVLWYLQAISFILRRGAILNSTSDYR